MTSVTEPGGTATLAAIDGYRVAGKTGTARRTNPKGGYYDDQYRTAFVGIAPASNPRFVVAIMVEDPRVDKFGGLVAAPVFRQCDERSLCVCTTCRLTSRYRVKKPLPPASKVSMTYNKPMEKL